MTATTSEIKDDILLLLAKEKNLADLERMRAFMMDIVQDEGAKDQILTETAVNAIRKIKAFAILGNDWDSYGAEKIKIENVEKAIEWVKQLNRFHIVIGDVFPTRNGGIQLELDNGEVDIEIVVEEETEVTVYDSDSTIQDEFILNDMQQLSPFINGTLHNQRIR